MDFVKVIPMKIVFLNGGLANQMFQYVLYRFGQIISPEEEWFLDDSFFYVNKVHNGYELEKVFGLHPNLLSEYFDRDVWEYMIGEKQKGTSIPEQLRLNGIDIRLISEYDNWKQWNPFNGRLDQLDEDFEDWMLKIEGNIYFNGYGITESFFRRIEKVIRSEFVFPEISDEANLRYCEDIKNTVSCAVHVRRGDYVTLGLTGTDELFDETYRDWIGEMLEKVPDITVFLFSDDPGYCEEHFDRMGFDKPGKVIPVKGNSADNAFRDMQLMSLCRHLIAGNSSFPYMASLINPAPGEIMLHRYNR